MGSQRVRHDFHPYMSDMSDFHPYNGKIHKLRLSPCKSAAGSAEPRWVFYENSLFPHHHGFISSAYALEFRESMLHTCPETLIGALWQMKTGYWKKEGTRRSQLRRGIHFSFVRTISDPFRSSMKEWREFESWPFIWWLQKLNNLLDLPECHSGITVRIINNLWTPIDQSPVYHGCRNEWECLLSQISEFYWEVRWDSGVAELGARTWGGVGGGTRTWGTMFTELLLCPRHQTMPPEGTKVSPTSLLLVLWIYCLPLSLPWLPPFPLSSFLACVLAVLFSSSHSHSFFPLSLNLSSLPESEASNQ